MSRAKEWLEKVRTLDRSGPVRVMNVCGGHERSISMSGMRTALPDDITLIAGPGCPVCVCPEEDIHLAIRIALEGNAILVAFGDMLRVPANVSRGEVRSLEEARAAGAEVLPVASPQEAWRIAQEHPDRAVCFFAAGFETTMAPVAAHIAQGVPDNLELLISGRLTWPAVKMLLDAGDRGFDALIAPGHVATVMGPQQWRFVPEDYQVPAAISGFAPDELLVALYSVLRQVETGEEFLDNCYPSAVHDGGNAVAKRMLDSVFRICDANWRGIGTIPASGFELRDAYAAHDARQVWSHLVDGARKRAGEMPPGCSCADVVLGRIRPVECPLYGGLCTPRSPVGPCMVSDEGACRIWWSAGHRESEYRSDVRDERRTTA